MTKEQLNGVLEKHKKWIKNEPGGERADLQGANLQRANLYKVDLWGADLRGANLREATFWGADLQGADFWETNLQGADLKGANLQGTDLQGANLQKVDLRGANNIPDYVCPMCCPEEGSFIGFKRAYWNKVAVIVKLQIPADAKRSSATTRKCRCNKAIVISITDKLGVREFQKAVSAYDDNFIYEVGKTVVVDDFDENRWNECSTGIHFFITRNEAINY